MVAAATQRPGYHQDHIAARRGVSEDSGGGGDHSAPAPLEDGRSLAYRLGSRDFDASLTGRISGLGRAVWLQPLNVP